MKKIVAILFALTALTSNVVLASACTHDDHGKEHCEKHEIKHSVKL